MSGKRGLVPRTTIYRFPHGTQLRTTEPPNVGDSLRSDGQAWVVVEVNEDDDGYVAVVLRPRDDDRRDGAVRPGETLSTA
jgi:hypothetical protein